jgi:hypothetical protein
MIFAFALGALSIGCAVASGVIGSSIADLLDARGTNANRRNFALLRRTHVVRYLRAYRDVTQRETGRVGSLYYAYVGSVVGMGLFGVTAIVLRIALLSMA